jgi:hypothetical protein
MIKCALSLQQVNEVRFAVTRVASENDVFALGCPLLGSGLN